MSSHAHDTFIKKLEKLAAHHEETARGIRLTLEALEAERSNGASAPAPAPTPTPTVPATNGSTAHRVQALLAEHGGSVSQDEMRAAAADNTWWSMRDLGWLGRHGYIKRTRTGYTLGKRTAEAPE